MSAAEAQAEPTMEEILASIRKIISEDDKPQEPQAAPEPQDDFLELSDSEPVDEHVSADFDFDALSLDEPEPIAQTVTDDFESDNFFEEDPVQDSFENDDIIAVDIEPDPIPEPVFEAPPPRAKSFDYEPAFEPPPIFSEPAPVSNGSRMPPHLAESIGLIGQDAANAASDAFARLGTAMPGHFANGVSVEELVAHLLKPMLKDWLDNNLPRIVEERVEAELARIARRGF